MMWRAIILLLLAVYVFADIAWLNGRSEMLRILLCHFFHANIFHLLANALSVSVMFRRWKAWQLVISFVIAVLSVAVYPSAVIGFSNVIYAMIGLKTPSFDSKWWRLPSTKIFLVVTAAMLLFPNVSAITHIKSFVLGLLVAVSVRWFNIIRNDSARYI